MSTPSGLVIMLHESDQDYPIYHMNPELRPLLPEFATGNEMPPGAEEMPPAPPVPQQP
jgi:hypothetical protein